MHLKGLLIGHREMWQPEPFSKNVIHDDVIKWNHFPRYWPFVRRIHRSPVNSPHKGQWRGALMFSLICVWINGWVNNREAGDLRRYREHYDVTLMRNSSYCSYVNVSEYIGDQVNIGSGNCMVVLGNMLLSVALLIQIYVTIWNHLDKISFFN